MSPYRGGGRGLRRTKQREPRARASSTAPPGKLTPPFLNRVFPRERLYARLDAALESGHVWLEGPPGSGKTTLAASYVRHRRLRCLWYRIDAGDTDVATFFHYLHVASTQLTRRQRQAPRRFTREYVSDPAAFGRLFFEELLTGVRSPLNLVLDNYQEVAEDAVLHDVLCESLLHLGEAVRAIIVSRGSAPPAFARLNVYVPVTTLRGGDLELTPEEARGIAALRIGAEKSNKLRARIDELLSQAHGWLAGLILLLEGDYKELAPADTLATASRQAVFNYFAKEIYDRSEPLAQDVLARLAILPEMTAWLAQNLTHSLRAGEILDALHRRNYFVSYQAQSDSYHFHPLFREFLLERLRERVSPAELTVLRHDAARLLERRGLIDPAIELYRETAEWESVVRLALSEAPRLAQQSRFSTIAAWLERLPDDVVESEPWVIYWRGVCKTASAPQEARVAFEAAFAAFDRRADPAGLYLTWAGIIETIQLEWSDFHPVDEWIAVFEQLRERFPGFPSPEIEISVVGAVVCGLATRNLHHPLLPEWLARAETLIAGDASTPWWSTQLVWYYLWMGRPDRVRALVERVGSAAAEADSSPSLALLSRVTLAMYEWCLGDPRAARREVEEGLQFLERHYLIGLCHQLLGQGVYADLARGASADAKRYLQQMASLPGRRGRIETAFFHHLASMIAVHEGDLTAAAAHATTALEMADAGGQRFAFACCLCMQAYIALLREQREQAYAYLSSLCAIGEETGSLAIRYWHRIGEALAKLRFEGRAAALSPLAEALALSRQLGGQSMPWLPHTALAEAYAVALEHGLETHHVKSLIRRLEVAPTAESYGLEAWPYRVKVRTLGAFGVQVDEAPLKFSTKAQKRPLELLQALVAFGGKNVSETKVAEALWPELDADGARRSLASALHRLRKLIGDDSVGRQRGLLTLSSRHCWIDLWAVQRLLTLLTKAQAERRTDAVATIASSLLALYRGAFLESEGDPPWALGTRERLRARLHSGLEAAGRRLFEEGRHESAISCYRRALEVDPLAESTYRGLIETYLSLDRRAEALLTYRRCEKLLSAELGVAPSPRTRTLLEGVRRSPQRTRRR